MMAAVAKVLIATDGSDLAVEAARRALDLLDPSLDLVVVTVVTPPVVAGGAPLGAADGVGPAVVDPETTVELDHALTEEAQAGLQRTVAALGREATTRLLHGDPAAEICREAEDGGYDLIVIGSHGYGVVKRVLLGSVSHHVLHHAPCPVLVMRQR
jgi:nucleotide-binding universal stress UspA family protein